MSHTPSSLCHTLKSFWSTPPPRRVTHFSNGIKGEIEQETVLPKDLCLENKYKNTSNVRLDPNRTNRESQACSSGLTLAYERCFWSPSRHVLRKRLVSMSYHTEWSMGRIKKFLNDATPPVVWTKFFSEWTNRENIVWNFLILSYTLY